MRGVTDPDFRLPKYGNGETHGLVTAGGHVLDEDEFTIASNGIPQTKPHRQELMSRALPGPTRSHNLPLGGQDLVVGSMPLYMGNSRYLAKTLKANP